MVIHRGSPARPPESLKDPIFVLGILPRSGTNYLARLLALHPDCLLARIPEDWTRAESQHLEAFVRAVSTRWRRSPRWQVAPDAESRLYRTLGGGVIAMLSEQRDDRRLITKTPSVAGLEHFFALFPEAYLLILVRDGRGCVESAAQSFGRSRHDVTRQWVSAARGTLAFDRARQATDRRYRIVRFEDLVLETETQVKGILDFLHLNVQAYDFAQMTNLPVFGSSAARNDAGDWEWRETPASQASRAAALQRWAGWSRGQHERFNWIAGETMEERGYRVTRFSSGRLFWSARTAAWWVRDAVRKTALRSGRVLRRTP